MDDQERTAAARIADLREFYAHPSMEVDPLLPEHAAIQTLPAVLDHVERVLRRHTAVTGTAPLYEVPWCHECGYVYTEDDSDTHTADYFDALDLLDVMESVVAPRRRNR